MVIHFTGNPAPEVEWLHEGEILIDGDEIEIILEGSRQCLMLHKLPLPIQFKTRRQTFKHLN